MTRDQQRLADYLAHVIEAIDSDAPLYDSFDAMARASGYDPSGSE